MSLSRVSGLGFRVGARQFKGFLSFLFALGGSRFRSGIESEAGFRVDPGL